MLPWSFTAHYDSEPARREEFHRLLERGLPSGYAADDGAALHFVGRGLHRVVSSRQGKAGYALRRGPEGVIEDRLAADYLGETDQSRALSLAPVAA